jgi:hypothetical protein
MNLCINGILIYVADFPLKLFCFIILNLNVEVMFFFLLNGLIL